MNEIKMPLATTAVIFTTGCDSIIMTLKKILILLILSSFFMIGSIMASEASASDKYIYPERILLSQNDRFEVTVPMQGMYSYMADAALFKECITGLTLPVLFEKENLVLERAYNKDKKEAGALLKIHVEGKIVQRPKMEGEGMQAHLLVEHFIKTMPNELCGNQYVDASISNTYWKLTSLYTEGVKTKSNNREAYIIFRSTNGEFKGATGCNTMLGNYEREGKSLTISHEEVAMPRVACPDRNIEKSFLSALIETKIWNIKGDHLEFLDDSSKVLARFEAIYF